MFGLGGGGRLEVGAWRVGWADALPVGQFTRSGAIRRRRWPRGASRLGDRMVAQRRLGQTATAPARYTVPICPDPRTRHIASACAE